MQRYANLPVKAFIESHLRPFQTDETTLNNLSCQYLWSRHFDSACAATEHAAQLMLTIYDWGHYPSRVIAFVCSWKHRSGLEDSSSSSLLQSLADMLVDLLMDNPHSSARRLYLKLLGLIRLSAIRDQKQLQKAIWAALSSLGIHYQLDRLVLLFLIKCTLKISEKIKEYKYMIGQECARLIFAMFSSEYLQTAPVKEMAKLYMDFLKLLVALGREIAVCPSGNSSKTLDHFYLSCFFKVMASNLSLVLDEQQLSGWFDYSNMNLLNLVRDPEFKAFCVFEGRAGISGVCRFQPMPLIYPDLEQTHEEANQGNMGDAELLEKIKTNSIALLMVLARVEPELLLAKDIFPIVYPHCLQNLDSSGVYESQDFFPVSIFNREVGDVFRHVYRKPTISIHFVQYLNMVEHRTEAARSILTNFQRQLIGILKSSTSVFPDGWNAQMSLLGFFMTETNYQVKSCLINAIGVIHNQVYTILEARERTKMAVRTDQNTIVKTSCEGICKFAINFMTAFFCDMYKTELPNLRHLLEGLHQCPVQSMLVHLPNKFVERVIHFLVVPVLAACLHTHFDFCEQFDKFLATIFEARFSEFFLARINCLRELLVHNFSLSRATRQSCEQYGVKVKVLISAADELMDKFPHQMKQEYGFFGDFALKELLTDKALSTTHYFAPLMLSRIACLQRDLLTDYSAKTGLQSLTLEDFRDQKSTYTDLCDFQQYEEIQSSYSILQDYQKLWPFIERLFIECTMSAVNFGVKDKFEKYLISGILMIGPPMFELLDRTLNEKHKISLETCFLDIFTKLRNKKHQLLLIEHLLSSSVVAMPELRKKLWAALFQMYKEKVLSVEIVFSNNMIIHGLRDSPELINTSQVVEIFKSSAGSLKSKNRKLINNCLKIFGNILTHYPTGVVEWILNMDVPNCFADEMPANHLASHKTLKGRDFLTLILERFLAHKYSKYNVLTLSCLTNILKRHEAETKDPLSRRLVDMATCSQAAVLVEKFISSESFRFISLAISYFSKDICQLMLTQIQLQNLATACWVQVISQEGKKDFSHLEQLGWQEIRYRAWLLFLKIANSPRLDKLHTLELTSKLVSENKKVLVTMMEYEKKYLTELRQEHELQERYLVKHKTVRQELACRDFQTTKLFIEELSQHMKQKQIGKQLQLDISNTAEVKWVLARLEEECLMNASNPQQIARLPQRSGDMTTRSNSPAARSDRAEPVAN